MSLLAFMISVKVMWAKVIFTSNIFGLIKKNCQRTQCDSKNDILFNNINVTRIIKTNMWPLRLAQHCKHFLSCVTVTCIVWYVFVHRWGGPPSQPSGTVGFSAVQDFFLLKSRKSTEVKPARWGNDGVVDWNKMADDSKPPKCSIKCPCAIAAGWRL